MRSPGRFFEEHGGAIGGIFGAVAVMLVVAPLFLPSIPRLAAQIMFGVCALVALLGVWGLFSKKGKVLVPLPPLPQPSPPTSGKSRTAIKLRGTGISITDNKIHGFDTGIDVEGSDIDVDDNKID